MYGVQTGYGSGAVIPPVKRSSTIDREREHTRVHTRAARRGSGPALGASRRLERVQLVLGNVLEVVAVVLVGLRRLVLCRVDHLVRETCVQHATRVSFEHANERANEKHVPWLSQKAAASSAEPNRILRTFIGSAVDTQPISGFSHLSAMWRTHARSQPRDAASTAGSQHTAQQIRSGWPSPWRSGGLVSWRSWCVGR